MARSLIIVLAIALYAAVVPAAAQSRADENFSNELSYGVNFNSNGGLIGGVFMRSSYYKRDRFYQFGAVELVQVKHPKELPVFSAVGSGETFIFGKQNYLFVVRPQYGVEYVLFKKAAESGVQVNAVGAAGPSVGLMVPYYVRYSVGTQRSDDIRTAQYDPSIPRGNIHGSGGVFTGVGETKLNPGVHFKAGLSFEYGRYHESITGVEAGFLVEHFLKNPILMPEADNPRTFTSVYLHLYYGRRK